MIHVRSIPRGATKPLAIAQALLAWFTAEAPMALILGACPATIALATMEPTEAGLLDPDTFMIVSSCSDIGNSLSMRVVVLDQSLVVSGLFEKAR